MILASLSLGKTRMKSQSSYSFNVELFVELFHMLFCY
jgi:hypothetical protein